MLTILRHKERTLSFIGTWFDNTRSARRLFYHHLGSEAGLHQVLPELNFHWRIIYIKMSLRSQIYCN